MNSYFFRPNPYGIASEAQREAQSAARKAQDTATQLEFMKRDIERLLMISEALWTLLQRAHGYTEEDLKNLINEIDLRDSQLDGRSVTKRSSVCPSCNRTVSVRHSTCIYCGQVLQHDPFGR